MRAWMRPRLWRTQRHRFGVAGLCLAYLLAALDLPLPASVRKETSQPFPCQNHPCGCQTAEQCWRSCCCFTPEQRWAWARAHHVEPPAYAEKPIEKPVDTGWNAVKLRDRDNPATAAAPRACCQQHRTRATAAAPAKSCCRTEKNRPAESPPVKKGRVRWTSTMTAWRCQGMTTLWVSSGAVMPVPPIVAWSPDRPLISPISLADEKPRNLPRTPLPPPPRSAVL